MSWFSRRRVEGGPGPILRVERLDVYYGRAHALQDVSLTLDRGILAVVGRNGMGKTTLCNAITGPGGGVRQHQARRRGDWSACRRMRSPASASATCRRAAASGRRSRSTSICGSPNAAPIAASWTVERIYEIFPRLAERRGNGGAQLSGGEQQMLAIGRALLFNPRLLVMDEPTEGLAPVIVEQVAEMLKSLGDEALSVLLVEQNLGVAIDVADTVAVMVNGRIARTMPAAELAADRDLQQRLLGVTTAGDVEDATRPRPRRQRRRRPKRASSRCGAPTTTARCRTRPRRRRRRRSAPCAASRAGTRPTPRSVRATRSSAAGPSR